MIFDDMIHFVAGQPGSFGAACPSLRRTRLQSSPSSSPENCAADNRITPSSIFGQ